MEKSSNESTASNSLVSGRSSSSSALNSNTVDDQNLTSTIMTLLGLSNGNTHFATNQSKETQISQEIVSDIVVEPTPLCSNKSFSGGRYENTECVGQASCTHQ